MLLLVLVLIYSPMILKLYLRYISTVLAETWDQAIEFRTTELSQRVIQTRSMSR